MKPNLLQRVPLAAFATALALACGERDGPLDPAVRDQSGGPALVKASLPPGTDLLLTASTTVEIIEPQWIRELREITALFAQNPIGSNGPVDLEVQVELAPAGEEEPHWIIAVQGAAWLDGGDFYKFDVSGPNDVPAVIRLLRVEDGQTEDFTGQLASAAGKLRFLPNAKIWSLSLELTGIVLPSGLAAQDGIGGAVEGGLKLGATLLPAVIREAEAVFQGDGLHLVIGSAIEHLNGGDGLRERVESAYHFTGLEPLDANGSPIDLRIVYEGVPTGNDQPCWQRFIPAEAWQPDGTGGFKFQASGLGVPAVIEIVKELEGQVTELTGHIAAVEARLLFDAVAKAWLLSIELTSDEVIAPMFHPMLGAHTVTLDGGESLLPAGLREAQARFF